MPLTRHSRDDASGSASLTISIVSPAFQLRPANSVLYSCCKMTLETSSTFSAPELSKKFALVPDHQCLTSTRELMLSPYSFMMGRKRAASCVSLVRASSSSENSGSARMKLMCGFLVASFSFNRR